MNASFFFKKHYLNYAFRRLPFLLVIFINSCFYLLVTLFSRALAMMVTYGKAFKLVDFEDPRFMGAILFIFTFMLVYNLLDEISLLTGQKQLVNFALGKYSNPQMESRMIMFIDMTDSTKIAEQIGDKLYLSLLDEFFSLMTIPLSESKGEIYKYIGDEAIITWDQQNKDAYIPVKFFYKFKKAIQRHEKHFKDRYGTVPKFKAGLHYGTMMIGELGSAKKEIALIGDSINTTSRILGIGKKLNHELVLSEILGKQFSNTKKAIVLENLGEQAIRGKEEKLVLYSIESTFRPKVKA